MLAEDIDIIACEAAHKTKDERNQAILNLRNQSPESTIDGVTLRRFSIDSDVAMLVGFTRVKGTVRNIRLEDIQVRGNLNGRHFITTEEDGSVSNITFTNVSFKNRPAAPVGDPTQWSLTDSHIHLKP
ncbi:MAG: hypothetical protein SynsKO_43300 [Synoicihabitans sp.]